MGSRSNQQLFGPIVLLGGGEMSQEQFDPLILVLQQSISLGVEH